VIDAVTPPPPAGQEPPPGAAPGEPGRIEWLFRDSLRRREIHPLMRLVLLHRQRAAIPPEPGAA